MRAVQEATAIAGKGLDGDRYATGTGHWSAIRRRGDQLTLVEIEELESVAAAHGLRLPPGATRRNITTRGVRLDGLIGRRFQIGEVECRGTRRCEPCSWLDELLGQEALPALIHRAGIRAEVTKGGRLAAGDSLQVLPD
jgi:MOSC domain-containing protein YiiM